MKLLFGYKSVDEIRQQISSEFSLPLQKEKRGRIRIGVIDDQPFEAAKNLRNYGYDIIELKDVQDVRVVEGYPIILCDLMGVGSAFDQEMQGASLIKEIRRNYPVAVIAAYTGSPGSSEITKRAKFFADGFIQKDADLEAWTEQLDALIKLAVDPREIWRRTRVALIEEGTSTKQLLSLEDAFVRSVNSRDASFTKVTALVDRGVVAGTTADIVKGVISSGIFALLFA